MFMKNIIPFKKDIIFKTNLSEITSISLENTLNLKDDTVLGEFIISGEYKVSDKSTTVEPFELKLPFEIVIDDRYDTDKATVDIDDFYYEIVNDNVLSVSIDVLIDKLQEKPLIELEDLVEVTPVREILDSGEESEGESLDSKVDEVREDKEEIINGSTEESRDEKNEVAESLSEESRKGKIKMVESEEKEVSNIVLPNKLEEQSEIVEEKMNSLFNQISKDSEVYVTYNVFILRDGDTIDSILEKYNITEEELRKYNDLSNLQLGDKIIIPNSYERN